MSLLSFARCSFRARVLPPPLNPALKRHSTPFPRLLHDWQPKRADALTQEPKTFADEFPRPSFVRPFGIGVSALVYTAAALETNRETEYWTGKALGGSLWKLGPPSSDDLLRAERLASATKLSQTLSALQKKLSYFSDDAKAMVNRVYILAGEKWLNMSEGRRICYVIGAVNAAVFAAWAIPRFRPFMIGNFCHHALSGRYYTMLTAVFSHQSFLHLLFNSIALTGFGASALVYLRKEQQNAKSGLQESTSQYHFLAFYITAGLFSSLLSHLIATRVRLPRLIAALSKGPSVKVAASAQSAFLPSLGASGAIYSTLAVTALAFPHAEIALIFLPMFPIPISWGMGSLVCLDLLGILRGWRMFDHWAHLGGAIFGGLYYYFGPQFWGNLRWSLAKSDEVKPHGILS